MPPKNRKGIKSEIKEDYNPYYYSFILNNLRIFLNEIMGCKIKFIREE